MQGQENKSPEKKERKNDSHFVFSFFFSSRGGFVERGKVHIRFLTVYLRIREEEEGESKRKRKGGTEGAPLSKGGKKALTIRGISIQEKDKEEIPRCAVCLFVCPEHLYFWVTINSLLILVPPQPAAATSTNDSPDTPNNDTAAPTK